MDKDKISQDISHLILWACFIYVLFGFVGCVQNFIPRERNLAESKVDLFLSSSELQMPLETLFPWDWEYFCTTGDYASAKRLSSVLGRPITYEEELEWRLFGSDQESEDNLIFVDKTGEMKIFPYNAIRRPWIEMPITKGHCVMRSSKLVVIKMPSKEDSNHIRSLFIDEF